MIPGKLESIDIRTIHMLIDNGIKEDRTLDYKQEIPRPERLLSDVCAFANTDGGDLVIGIAEEGGAPTGIIPLNVENADKEKLKIEQIISNGLEPKLYGCRLKEVVVDNVTQVLILRVPSSWSRPHRVKDSRRFMVRHESGNDDMDITELRGAFQLSASVPERMRFFREKRVDDIIVGESARPLTPGIQVILHILPLSAFVGSDRLIGTVDPARIIPMGGYHGTITHRINLDGSIAFLKTREDLFMSYTQMYRNGIMESALSFPARGGNKIFDIWYIEREIINAIRRAFDIYKEIDLQPPFFIFLCVNGLSGATLGDGAPLSQFFNANRSSDRDRLLIPEIAIDEYPEHPDVAARPLLDMLWNGFGAKGSSSYDENGKWQNIKS